MRTKIEIDHVQFTAAPAVDIEKGLIGYLSCRVNNSLQVNGLVLRRTRTGRPALSFPARTDRCGRQHFYLRPLDETTRLEIERQVFEALGTKEVPS